MAVNEEATEALASTHKLKLKPPTYDGNYATVEEWKYKFKAYMGIQDNIYPDLLARAERATTVHPKQHNISCSSNGVPTPPSSNGS